MKNIYIAGHKSPDLDSVIGCIAYAHLKNELDSNNTYVPVIAGAINAETEYVLEQCDLETPELKESLEGEHVILVDHNEAHQAIDKLEDAIILEIIDHHKMDFSYHTPVRIMIEPIGSSCNVIAKMYKADDVVIPQNIARAMLAASLTDTIISKSPTTTPEDIKIMNDLAEIAGVADWKTYGMEIFKVRSSVADLSDEQIITADYKDFEIGGHKIGIGQVETVDVSDFDDRTEGLLTTLTSHKESGGYHSVILFITDIIKEESHFLFASEAPDTVAEAFGQSQTNNTFIAPVLSRKKQVVPQLIEAFK